MEMVDQVVELLVRMEVHHMVQGMKLVQMVVQFTIAMEIWFQIVELVEARL